MKNNIILIFFSSFITILLMYIGLFFYTYLNLYESAPHRFTSLENLNFHQKYSTQIHHLRGGGEWFKNNELLVSEYLFSTINNFSKNQKNILFQGDSWAEQLTNKKRKNYYLAENRVKKFSLRNNFGFINAGVSSYSPTVMKLQFKILKRDFNINPNIVIAVFDQTDIGDEHCRYKNNTVYNNNELVAVKEDSYSGKPFDYSQVYGESKVLLENDSKFIKTYNLINFKIYYSYKKFIYKKFKNKKITPKSKIKDWGKCYWPEIQSYLKSSNQSELKYFSESIVNYVNYLLIDGKVEKLLLVSFPHKNHLDGVGADTKYKHNISNIIDDIDFKNKNIYHLNFSKLISKNKILLDENTYYKNDPYSHLSDDFYSSIFIKEILNNILKILKL